MAPKLGIDIHVDAADLLTLPISVSSSGANQVIPGASGQILRVYRIAIVASSANSVTFQDGTNNLSGPLPLAANQGLVLTFDTKPWYVTTSGNDFNITLSSSTAVNGILYFTSESGGVPATPAVALNGYVTEDELLFYTAEDGTTFYIQES